MNETTRSGAQHDVAIVGMACRFPDAPDTASFWENLRAGRSSFKDIPPDRWNHALFHSDVPRDHDKTYVRRGAFVDDVGDFAALHFGIAPRRVAVMDPQHRLILEAVRVALQDAGLEGREFDRAKMGTFLGVSSSEYRTLLSARTVAMQMAAGSLGEAPPDPSVLAKAAKAVEPISAFSIPGTLLNMTAANVAHLWGLGGPAFSIDAACASALVAIYDAVLYLRAGICDSALAGGVYLNLTPENLIGFARASAISKSGECRPFDAASDGFLQGEGAGVLVLKRLADAERDGDRIYAVIRGIGINNDGDTSDGPMAPSLSGQADCLRRAYADAGLPTGSVDMVECHGTATKVGDPIEVNALRQVLAEEGGARREKVWLSSVKANIGHTMSAAGVAGLMRATLALHHETIPPQANFSAPNPLLELEKGPFDVPRAPVAWPRQADRPRRAGISSFGFGGTNCHMVIEEAPPPRRVQVAVPAGQLQRELVVVGAANRALLARHAAELAVALEKDASITLGDAALSLSAGREHDAVRLAIVASTREELLASLKDAAVRLGSDEKLGLSLSPTTFVTPVTRDHAPRIAFMFPGQGAQRVGLLRHLFERFEGFRDRLLVLEKSLSGKLSQPLLKYLYPAVQNGELKQAEERLQATEVCQPVMAALGLALAGFLEDLGISPAVCLGHSLGEFVAAGAGGMLTPEEALAFVAERGRQMSELALPDPGAMAAVRADAETVGRFLAPGVCIANCNHPQQTVISGTTPAVEAAMARLKEAGFASRALRVSHAFHSELMQDVTPGLAALVERLDLREPRRTVVSAITGEAYSAIVEDTRATFVRHATASVDFVSALRKSVAVGAEFFLEVGAGSTLSNFVSATLPADQHLGSCSLAAADDDKGLELYRALGMLAVLGQPIHYSKLQLQDGRRVATLPSAPLVKERYWATRSTGTVAVAVSAGAHAAPSPALRPASKPEVPVSDDLIKLFREQTALLAQHAEIIARQTAALSGQPLPAAAAHPLPAAAPVTPVNPLPTAPVSTATPAAAPAAAAPAGPAVAPAPAALPKGKVLDTVMDAVAKISAFPKASLKPTQSLVNELGLDSLMVMELVSAVQAAFPEAGELPQSLLNQKTTIADLVNHIESSLASATPVAETTPTAAAAALEGPQEPQRYLPVLQARPRSAFQGPSLPAGAWTLVTTDGGALGEAVVGKLVGAGRDVAVVRLGQPFAGIQKDAAGVVRLAWSDDASQIDALFAELIRAEVRPQAVLHLAAVGLSRPVSEVLESGAGQWPNPVPVAQRLAANVFAACEARPLAFATVTGLGGGFGLEDGGGAAVWQSALAGFTKALSREWDASVKAIDVDPAQPAEAVAAQIVDELASADRDVEVGYRAGVRQVIALVPAAFEGGDALPLDENSVVLLTGGGRGLGAKVALDLATRTRCRLILVGSSEPKAGDELTATLDGLRKAGSKVEYVRWDIRRAEAPAALEKARAALGAITGIVHCAGLIRDRRVAEKKVEDVREVMDVKIAGLLNVLRATRNDPVTLLAGFSSWSGRFGNAGQTDYSAANELLNRLVTGLGQKRPELRAASIAWPPWEGSAMADSIPAPLKSMMRKEGIPFLTESAGLTAFRRQLAGKTSGEVLMGLGQPPARTELRAQLTLSTETHPYLDDHQIKGTPVLPMASALDLLAALAQERLGPGLDVHQLQLFNGVEVKAPVSVETELKQKGSEPAHLELRANGRVSYRAQAVLPARPTALTLPEDATKPLPLALDAFYRDVAFHGPSLRGIDRVEKLGEKHIVGWVRPSRPQDLMPGTDRAGWAVDPLVVDSAFQLVLYFVWANLGKQALPLGFKRYVQVAPFTGPVKCTLVLGSAGADTLVGSIQFEDEQGRLLAVMTDAQAKLLEASKTSAAGRNGNGASKPAVEIAEEHWNIEKFQGVKDLKEKLSAAAEFGLDNPYFHINDGIARDMSIVDGKPMINYSSYNYLGLSGNPNVSASAKAAVDRYGTSVSASRVASGEKPIHRELEAELADFLGTEAAVCFTAGHATNETVIGFMMGEGDLILHDSLAHNSIQQGAILSGAKRRPFPHSDWKALDQLLTQLRPHYKKVLVAIEGVYSMDGDYPDLPKFIELRNKHKCLLFVDEAHSVGVMGATARGIGEHFQVDRKQVDVWMGTLSKSFASCGGYIAGTKALVDYVKYSAPGFVFSAGLSPANAGAALGAIREIKAHPEYVTTLHDRCRLFVKLAKAKGIDTGLSDGSAVVPAIIGNSLMCLMLSQRLADRGINVQPIVYPAVDENASRLRFFLSATHTEAQIRKTVNAIAAELVYLRSAGEEQVAEEPEEEQPVPVSP